jgi:hypothetical protein
MKTTLDLPDHLVRQAKQRALQQGHTLKDLVAEYIRQGLHGTPSPAETLPGGVLDVDECGLPLFRRDPCASGSAADLTTALQLEQQALEAEDQRRAGLPG